MFCNLYPLRMPVTSEGFGFGIPGGDDVSCDPCQAEKSSTAVAAPKQGQTPSQTFGFLSIYCWWLKIRQTLTSWGEGSWNLPLFRTGFIHRWTINSSTGASSVVRSFRLSKPSIHVDFDEVSAGPSGKLKKKLGDLDPAVWCCKRLFFWVFLIKKVGL